MSTYPEFDMNEAQECVERARGIVEMIGPYLSQMLGPEDARAVLGGVWAASDLLDRLAVMTGLDPKPEAQP
ncbi:hypothetical protein N799_07270 [Lysobacter arseniciresistens ZS79]|uniref:Uncharacterized protein n=1 Tax=Lysobacter arseniciresistens ZS79 TaxID=913325 RepID=A0A0A0EWS8_9GAMM|nr:hypothetical protein N799_07270 [Lysobacter arseniciresistens ZS79]